MSGFSWTWINKGLHLPRWLRDFHDQKDVFKAIADWNSTRKESCQKVESWVDAQIYVIDCFLIFMAAHGYTLQRTDGARTRGCADIAATIKYVKDKEVEVLQRMLGQNAKGDAT